MADDRTGGILSLDVNEAQTAARRPWVIFDPARKRRRRILAEGSDPRTDRGEPARRGSHSVDCHVDVVLERKHEQVDRREVGLLLAPHGRSMVTQGGAQRGRRAHIPRPPAGAMAPQRAVEGRRPARTAARHSRRAFRPTAGVVAEPAHQLLLVINRKERRPITPGNPVPPAFDRTIAHPVHEGEQALADAARLTRDSAGEAHAMQQAVAVAGDRHLLKAVPQPRWNLDGLSGIALHAPNQARRRGPNAEALACPDADVTKREQAPARRPLAQRPRRPTRSHHR